MKVLIIDDDPGMTGLLNLLLKSASSEIFTANSGQDGVDLVKSKSPDIIILDLMMPEMDGYEVCHAIRSFAKTPILVLSALDMPGTVTKALDAGADDYLIKPVTSSILIAHLNNLLRRVKPTPINSTPNRVSIF